MKPTVNNLTNALKTLGVEELIIYEIEKSIISGNGDRAKKIIDAQPIDFRRLEQLLKNPDNTSMKSTPIPTRQVNNRQSLTTYSKTNKTFAQQRREEEMREATKQITIEEKIKNSNNKNDNNEGIGYEKKTREGVSVMRPDLNATVDIEPIAVITEKPIAVELIEELSSSNRKKTMIKGIILSELLNKPNF